MTWIDYGIIGIIAVSALVGLARGLMREVLSFVIWLGALFIAWTFYKELAAELSSWVASPTIRLGVAFLILVFLILILGAIFGHLLSILVRKTELTGTDRALGAVFGTARGAIVVAMLVFLGALTPVAQDDWWQQSTLTGRFEVLAQRILDRVPQVAADKLKSL